MLYDVQAERNAPITDLQREFVELAARLNGIVEDESMLGTQYSAVCCMMYDV